MSMCTYATVKTTIEGSAKGLPGSWFGVTDGTIYFDLPGPRVGRAHAQHRLRRSRERAVGACRGGVDRGIGQRLGRGDRGRTRLGTGRADRLTRGDPLAFDANRERDLTGRRRQVNDAQQLQLRGVDRERSV